MTTPMPSPSPRFARVVVLAPIDYRTPRLDKRGHLETLVDFDPRHQVFTYGIPRDLRGLIEPGQVVEVPFGHTQQLGLVLSLEESAPLEVEVKPLGPPISEGPALTPQQMDLALWMSRYYLAPLSECVRLILPPGFAAKSDLWVTYVPDAPIYPDELTPGQQALLLRLKKAPMRLKELRQMDRRLVSDAVLGELRRQGLVRVVDRGKLKRPKPRIERVLTLAVSPEEMGRALLARARVSRMARALQWLVAQGGRGEVARLKRETQVPPGQVQKMVAQGWIQVEGEEVVLTLSPEQILAQRMALQGVDRLYQGLQALAQAPGQQMGLTDWRRATGLRLADARKLVQWGLITWEEVDILRDPLAGRVFHSPRPAQLSPDQQRAWKAIEAALTMADSNTSPASPPPPPPVFLLHGVTGSGKTEIYLRALEKVVAAGRQGIVLVPEISLTPQTIRRFAGRFPGRVAVIHSRLSSGERFDTWRRARSGQVDVVVGSRSALFAPLPRIGLLVVDEEHDPAYKQQRTPRYHARDTAIELARLHGAVTILGSATPSLESQFKARRGIYTLLRLPRRVMGHREEGAVRMADLPPITVVDMRAELRAGNRSMFSRLLQDALRGTLDRGEQAILFLNRRGSASFVMCRDCGHVVKCPRCNIPLTHHQGDVLICHHCNYRQPMPRTCPKCGSLRFKTFGAGTERVIQALQAAFPQARPLRWDRDAVQGKGSHEAILQDFIDHKADVLVGTQMIAKGLDLPLVTLVGVLSAEMGLFLPDFRAAERTFQILMQVAGRAGRSERGGQVIFQTYHPTHYAILTASRHDYEGFYRVEMRYRQSMGYPPYRRLTRLLYLDSNRERCEQETARVAAHLQRRARELGIEGFSLIGPAPAFFSKERGKFRWHLLFRAQDPAMLLAGVPLTPHWRIDVDPVDVL